MLTLLSPAKTLDFSPAREGLELTQPRFESDLSLLLELCKKLSARSLEKLMGISRSLAELNHERFQNMSLPYDADGRSTDLRSADDAKPCLLAFKGDVYRGLEAETLSNPELEWAQDHLRVLSGLYGLLRPLDLIQPYRLEMGTRLSNPRGKNLYDFWGPRLADALNAEHRKRPVAAVLNLASNEYLKAVPIERLEPPLVTAVFQEMRDGTPRTIGFFAKRARGLMARFVVRNRIEDPAGLLDFAAEGYGYRSDLSTDDRLVFTREKG